MEDQVYSKAQSHIVDFAFTAEVAQVFPDMIRRSVPGYETVIPMTGLVAARHLAQHGGQLAVDLGCSLGATTQALLAQSDNPDIKVVGLDNSEPMIEGAIEANKDPRASFHCMDILTAEDHFRSADVMLLNFVLQFFEPATRFETLKLLRRNLKDNGLLIVSEKLKDADEERQALFDATHLAWKRANGYSDLEVSQKRTALENVMIVDTHETHVERFVEAGFARVIPWYRCMNWASFLLYP